MGIEYYNIILEFECEYRWLRDINKCDVVIVLSRTLQTKSNK